MVLDIHRRSASHWRRLIAVILFMVFAVPVLAGPECCYLAVSDLCCVDTVQDVEPSCCASETDFAPGESQVPCGCAMEKGNDVPFSTSEYNQKESVPESANVVGMSLSYNEDSRSTYRPSGHNHSLSEPPALTRLCRLQL